MLTKLKGKPNFIFYLWIFMIGSVFGSMWEILWHFVRFLDYSNRTALVFGYWNVLYGMGGVIMTAVLVPFVKRGGLAIFLMSFLTGSVVEFIASVGQEIVFGASSWNYSSMPLNLFGRINLVYSLFWGLAGYLWMKYCYPKIWDVSEELPKESAYALMVFLIINIVFSVFATFRWKLRLEGKAGDTDTLLERFLDFFFNNEAMSFVYPNWHFGSS